MMVIAQHVDCDETRQRRHLRGHSPTTSKHNIELKQRINNKQVAQLSQRGRAMRHVTEYFAKSLKVIRNDTFEYGLSPYSVVTSSVSRIVS